MLAPSRSVLPVSARAVLPTALSSASGASSCGGVLARSSHDHHARRSVSSFSSRVSEGTAPPIRHTTSTTTTIPAFLKNQTRSFSALSVKWVYEKDQSQIGPVKTQSFQTMLDVAKDADVDIEGRLFLATARPRPRCLRGKRLVVIGKFDLSPAFFHICCSFSGWDLRLFDRLGGWIELRRIWPRT